MYVGVVTWACGATSLSSHGQVCPLSFFGSIGFLPWRFEILLEEELPIIHEVCTTLPTDRVSVICF